MSRWTTRNQPFSRILQVSAYYPPHVGGQESVVEQLSSALNTVDVPVRVLSSRLPKNSASAGGGGVVVQRLWAFEVAHTPIIPLLPIALARHARGSMFHIHMGQAFVPEIAAGVATIYRRPYVAQVHLVVRPSGRAGRLLPLYERVFLRSVLRRAKQVVCLTEPMRQEVVETYKLSPGKVSVIANGVRATGDAALTEPAVATSKAGRAKVILFVGRLATQKNVSLLLQVASLLSSGLTLRIIGDGELGHSLHQQAAELHLSNVIFEGAQSASYVRRAMSDALLLVLPSTHEGMPLVLLEAYSAGLASVISDIPELRQFANSSEMVDATNVSKWVKAIESLAHDDAARSRLQEAGRCVAREHRWDHIAELWRNTYLEATRGRS